MMKSFEGELVRLKGMVRDMGGLTGLQLEAAIRCTEGPNSELAATVIQREPEANRMMHEIDNMVIRVLALRQPWAVDLREVLSALRIAIELERICDHAEDLAQRVITLRHARIEPMHSLVNLGCFAMKMVNDAMHAYMLRANTDAKVVRISASLTGCSTL
jgi:phosphate transport system protein